jgi:hypothetical protein
VGIVIFCGALFWGFCFALVSSVPFHLARLNKINSPYSFFNELDDLLRVFY